MTHLSVRAAALAATCCVTLATAVADVDAQCMTCPTPTVAFAPVVAPAPVAVVAPRVGLFDRWRMRRWGVTAPVVAAPVVTAPVVVAPTFATSAVPTVSAGFPQTVTAGFAPATTAGFTPYFSAFAPLQPATVFRPAVLTPVVTQPACTSCGFAPAACETCTSCATPCDSCTVAAYASAPVSSCSSCAAGTVVEQASFAAPSSGCASCATGVVPSGSSTDPLTPQPQIDPNVGVPMSSGYVPANGTVDPGPATDAGAANSFYAPQLLPPANDNSANNSHRPTVDVHTAVYRRPVGAASVSTSTAPVQRAVDAGSWDSVPATR